MVENDGATGARGIVGARPVEHGRELYSGFSISILIEMGVKELAPGVASPSFGRERGATLAIPTERENTKFRF